MKKFMLTNKIIIFILFILLLSVGIAILFSGTVSPKTYVGQIAQKKITAEQLEKTMTYTKIQAMLRYGILFEQLKSLFDLEEEAWNQLILIQEAQKRGIKIPNQEVIEEIAKNDIFYRNKKFDPSLYKGIIKNSFQCEVKDFEETIRQSLLIAKLFDNVTKEISVSEKELMQEYKKSYEQLKVYYSLFPMPEDLSVINVTPDEITNYYIAHHKDFYRPLSIKIGYVKLPFPADGGVQKEVETKYKAIALRDQYAITKNLRTLAEKSGWTYQETTFFSKNNPPREINWPLNVLRNAFKMKKGAIHEPVELEDGYLVFIIQDIKKPGLAQIQEAQEEIKNKITKQKAIEIAKNNAESYKEKMKEILDDAIDEKTLEAKQKELGLIIKASELVSKTKLFTDLTIDLSSENEFYALNTEKEIAVLATHSGACLVYVKNFQPVQLEDFEKNKNAFKAELIKKIKTITINKFVEQLINDTPIEKK
ncbi:MAG TPA: SurA N-terminal domain-containing protein [Candidatus Omnitrophota bacterium]|nr:SurA N-terminal domain-containing protein [Candidatus Omnitrophota bacterium]HPN88192.1 SurA N-terminal domain-containing protein [Candidatus Omnitrophota bacterium]